MSADPGSRPGAGLVRSRMLWAATAVVVLAGGVGLYTVLGSGDAEGADDSGTVPDSTAQVSLETISDTRELDGVLGHGSPIPVAATGQGVVTRTAAQGAEVERGSELYRIDENPVMALFGAVPMYRDLREGDSGVDVAQLAVNLAEMGHGHCEGDLFDWCVVEAVLSWQAELGVEQTGEVSFSEVVFLAHGGRVETVQSEPGTGVSPGTPVLEITGSDQAASLELDLRDRDLLTVGEQVTVVLPDGNEIPGTVSDSEVLPADPAAEGGSEDLIVHVEVALDEPADEAFLGAPVDVAVEVDERADVLTVPVTALVALAGGGHGLEVVTESGRTELVAVDTGLFADGLVEVSGPGIEEGTEVGVAGR